MRGLVRGGFLGDAGGALPPCATKVVSLCGEASPSHSSLPAYSFSTKLMSVHSRPALFSPTHCTELNQALNRLMMKVVAVQV